MFGVNFVAVDLGDEIPARGDIKHSQACPLGERYVQAKRRGLFRQERERILPGRPNPTNPLAVGLIVGILPADPLCFPVLGTEQAHIPPRVFGRFRDLSCRIPHPNLPVIALARFERRPAIANRHRSLVLATNIWYALCFQLRSRLSLCQDRCGVSVSMPRGFSRYSQRKTTGVADATEVNMADTASTTISLRRSTELLRGPAGHSNEMMGDLLRMAGMVSPAPCRCQ